MKHDAHTQGFVVAVVLQRLRGRRLERGAVACRQGFDVFRPPPGPLAVVREDALLNGGHGGLLVGCAQRGHHAQAGGVGLGAKTFHHHAACHLGRMAGLQRCVQRRAQGQLLGPRRGKLAVVDQAGFAQTLQHHPLALRGALQVDHRVGVVRVLRQAHQHGRFGPVELVQRLAKVGLRRRRKPVGALAQEDLVDIDLQDAVFAEHLLHLQRQQDFLGLALWREVLRQQHGAHELLGDGGGTLPAPAGQHGKHGARHTLRIDAAVAAKAAVFHGQQRVLEAPRHLRQRRVLAPLGAELGNLHAVGRQHLQRLARLVVDDAVDGWQLEGCRLCGGHGRQRQHQQQRQGQGGGGGLHRSIIRNPPRTMAG